MAYSVDYSSCFLVCCSSSTSRTCTLVYYRSLTCCLLFFMFQSSQLQRLLFTIALGRTYFLLATEESCIVVSPSLSTSTLLELSSLPLSLAPSDVEKSLGSAHLFALYFSTSILIVPVVFKI